MSKNIPTDKALYSRVKAEAKSKFDRWPSAYGSAWLVKEYKKRGGGYRKAELGMEMSDNDFAGYVPADMQEYALGGGIPQRYKNQGFTKVGTKRQSTRPGKKWMVLAKKGDKYKVVHGGYKGMSDYTQHRNQKRRNRFWDRMGGKDSAKAKDPFSPLYWHKRFGTWAEGGEPQNEGFQALPPAVQAKIMANMMYGGTMYAVGGEWFNEDSQDFYRDGGQWIQEARESMEEKGTVGAFTKQARREGYENTQEFASYVLNNPEQFSATTKKRAQFAKNMGKLNRAMRGMELNKYQVQGQTSEGVNPLGYPGSGMGSLYLQELKDQELFAPATAETTDVAPKEMMSFMPTLKPGMIQQSTALPALGAQESGNKEVTVKETGWGYEPMGAKDDAWWQKGVAVAAYAPGIIANFMQSGQDQLAQAKGRRNYLTDYSDSVVSQGLALSRGEREMNTDQLDPVSRTPVQFGNYFQTGGEAMVDESILRDLIAAGADIEILD